MNHRKPGPTGPAPLDPAGPFGGGGRGRRAKLFDSEQIQLLLLALIAERARHGYELMRAIEERTGGTYAPSPGVIYPTLTLLTDLDQTRELAEPGQRKRYALTPAGRDRLAGSTDVIDELFARLDALGTAVARADSAPVRRAMHNLREVLIARLSRGGVGDEEVLEIARRLDTLAGEIERMK